MIWDFQHVYSYLQVITSEQELSDQAQNMDIICFKATGQTQLCTNGEATTETIMMLEVQFYTKTQTGPCKKAA